MEKNFETTSDKILVMGVGGCGCTTLRLMQENGVTGVRMVGVDSDKAALANCKAPEKLQIGANTTYGRSACGEMEKGARCVKESREQILRLLQGIEVLVLVCGMGSGTGGGATPAIAEMARELDILTIGIATKPFRFEGAKKEETAGNGIERLRSNVDALMLLPNDSLLAFVGSGRPMEAALRKIGETAAQVVRALEDLMPGDEDNDSNFPIQEIKEMLGKQGCGYIGVGEGTGSERCRDAVEQAIKYLQEENIVSNARSLVFSAVGDVSVWEGKQAALYMREQLQVDVNILWGIMEDKKVPKFARVFLMVIV